MGWAQRVMPNNCKEADDYAKAMYYYMGRRFTQIEAPTLESLDPETRAKIVRFRQEFVERRGRPTSTGETGRHV